jgi:hypothetical protein
VAKHGPDVLPVHAQIVVLAAVEDGQARDEGLSGFGEVLPAGTPVLGERDVTRPLVHGELELEVLGELAARAVDDAPVA